MSEQSTTCFECERLRLRIGQQTHHIVTMQDKLTQRNQRIRELEADGSRLAASRESLNDELADAPLMAAGMTLRDWFAGQALTGLVGSTGLSFYDRVESSYSYADSMLHERSK